MQQPALEAADHGCGHDEKSSFLCDSTDPRIERPPRHALILAHVQVMRTVLPGSKWILVGSSMGSIIAQSYMARHPDKVLLPSPPNPDSAPSTLHAPPRTRLDDQP